MSEAGVIEARLLKGSTRADLLDSIGLGLRVGAHVLKDRLSPPRLTDATAVPSTPDAITTEWLTDALCRNHTGVRVTAVRSVGGSSGTSVRATLELDYAGESANLPKRIFVKSAASFGTRITAGISGAMVNETQFYTLVRPLVGIEAPVGYHAASDQASFRSVLVTEDLVATKQASFVSAKTNFDRGMAEDVAGLLGTLHGTFDRSALLENRLAPIQTYVNFIRLGILRAQLKRFHFKGFDAASELLPERLVRARDSHWPLIVRSIMAHEGLPQTIIHGDTHPGNWYRTGEGRMGLLDWQCTARGNGTRDLAYALSTHLTIEDRRAWERDLIEVYRDAFARAGGKPPAFDHLFRLYRQQLWQPLLMWTPTYRPPPFFPDMQPQDISRIILERVGAALDDLDCYTAFDGRE